MIKSERKFLFFSFAAPVIVMGIAFAMHGVFPFGDRHILVVDFWQQYYPFFSDYWHKLRGGQSLLWSWSAGAGINYLGLIAYYLASPLNFLIVIFPHELLREAVTLILLLKIGCAGLFFALYLRYAYHGCGLSLPMFALFYALCAFTLGYYWNIMWFDTFALLPLVILGLHALIREGRWRVYVIALALAVMLNYYIGLFVCIFAVFMFILICASEGLGLRQALRKLLPVAAYSALALAMTAVLTVPAFLSLQKTYSALNAFPSSFRQYENYLSILGNFIAFTPPTTLEGLPNVYTGMLTVLLFGPFLQARTIKLREKLLYSGLIVFLILSCNINFLNFIWHGFHFTNMLPYRFSFLISFTAAIMAYRRLAANEELEYRDLAAMGLSGAFFLICAALGRQEFKHIAASAGMCAVYIALFAARMYLDKKAAGNAAGNAENARRKKKGKRIQQKAKPRRHIDCRAVLAALLAVAVIGEYAAASYIGVTTTRTTQRSIYPDKYDDVQQVLDLRSGTGDAAGANGEEGGAGFYRTETVNWYTTNDPSLYGFDGVSIFSSSVNRDTTRFMLGLGLYAGLAGNRYIYSQSTPVTNAFLNIRYLVSRSSDIPDEGTYWQRTGSSGDAVLLENTHYLPFGFITDAALADYTATENDPIASQNDLFRLATGLSGELFEKLDIIHVDYRGYDVTRHSLGNYSFRQQEGAAEKSLKWNYEMPRSGQLYVYVKIDRPENVRILQNDERVRSRRSPYPVLFCTGTFNEGDLVSVLAENERESGRAVIYAAVMDDALFRQGYEVLAAGALQLTRFSGTRVSGTADASEGGLLYTSIPYEKGWKAYVDGVQADIIPIGGSMAAVLLEAGVHTVEFRYVSDGLVPGIAITIAALAVFALLIYIEKKRNITGRHSM